MSIKINIANNIKKLRITLGISRDEIALRTNGVLNYDLIRKLECGRRSLKAEEVPKLAIAFNLSVKDLCEKIYENTTIITTSRKSS